MIEVRTATELDIERMAGMLLEWISEMNPDGMKIDPTVERLTESFLWMLRGPVSTVLVMVDGEELIGCLGLVLYDWGACRTPNVATENLWYVRKSHAGHASRLVRAARRWAAERKCDYLMFSTNRLSGADSLKGDEFLGKLGFRPLYQLHISEVDPCVTQPQ